LTVSSSSQLIEISLFAPEIQDFPFARQSENQILYGKSAQSLRLLPITIASPRFSRCRPRAARPKMFPAKQFHQISNDEFALLVDVANLGFRLITIGMVAIISGCHPRFK
jgi:hypothetical protein